jgi:hypothetical protein
MPTTTTRRALLAAGATAALLAARNRRTEIVRGVSSIMVEQDDPSPGEKMQRVLKAWALAYELAPELNDYRPGASVEVIAEVEGILGFLLPMSMRTLYSRHNGCYGGGGFGQVWPLRSDDPEELTLMSGNDLERASGLPIPHELYLFGDSLSESAYGMWEPEAGGEPVVVEIGDCSNEPCLGLVGQDLPSFLMARSAIDFVVFDSDWYDPEPMLDILGVPAELRTYEREVRMVEDSAGNQVPEVLGNEEVVVRGLTQWANPTLPYPTLGAYDHLLTADEINAFVANRER